VAAGTLSDLKPIYLIYGSEELLLERAEKRLHDRLAAVADLDFNFEVFDGGTASAS
jgi:DNA polymerase III delta subunit